MYFLKMQILTGNGFQWIASRNGNVPSVDGRSAVVGGEQSDGQVLYVGRARIESSLATGKIHPAHGCIYIPFDGREHCRREYEVLVAPRRCKSECDRFPTCSDYLLELLF